MDIRAAPIFSKTSRLSFCQIDYFPISQHKNSCAGLQPDFESSAGRSA
jgi:hypothetical protein